MIALHFTVQGISAYAQLFGNLTDVAVELTNGMQNGSPFQGFERFHFGYQQFLTSCPSYFNRFGVFESGILHIQPDISVENN